MHGDDRDIEVVQIVGVARWQVTGAEGLHQLCIRDVLDVRTAGAQLVDAGGGDVVADDRVRRSRGAHRQWQPDVPLTEHDDLRLPVLDPRPQPA